MKVIMATILCILLLAGCGDKKTGADSKRVGGQESFSAKSERSQRPMTGEESFGFAICSEVSKDTVARILGKTIQGIDEFSSGGNTGCRYYTDKGAGEYVVITVAHMSIENQKKGQQVLKRSVRSEKSLGMDNFLVLQEDGSTINAVYLVMTQDKFVRIDRSGKNVATNEQILDLSSKVAGIIQFK